MRHIIRHELHLTAEEQWIVNETLKRGNLNLFSERFFRLPNGGTRWMPNDALGHYRHLFNYDLLHGAWQMAGKPDSQIEIDTPDYQYVLRVLWEGDTPHFLLPHGYLFLDWSIPFVDRKTHLSLIESGTGVAKTSAMTVAALIANKVVCPVETACLWSIHSAHSQLFDVIGQVTIGIVVPGQSGPTLPSPLAVVIDNPMVCGADLLLQIIHHVPAG